MEKKTVTLYTDGACSGNPGPGGYGGILMYGGMKKEYNGGEESTTNNRMEMRAVIEGLSMLKYPCKVEVYSDSAYTVNAFLNGWLVFWQKNGWKKADKKPVSNVDLWQELLRLTALHEVTFHKVKGHADNEFNNRCDELARAAHLSLTGGREELRLRYVSQVADAPDAYKALLARLSRARSEDLRRMTTTVGIHRDDIAITIDGKEARTFASQGQQRSAVLSLKLAQLELAGQESGEAPILMLDDVMSELDPNRRRQLIERIDRVQTFVTCTDLSDLAGARQGAVYRVEKGGLTRL